MEFLRRNYIKIVVTLVAIAVISIIAPKFLTTSTQAQTLTGPYCQDYSGRRQTCYINQYGMPKWSRPDGNNDCQNRCR